MRHAPAIARAPRRLGRSLALGLAIGSLSPTSAIAQLVRSAAGPTAASIQPAVDQFRADLGGGIVAGANGSFGGVRREINWDGVPEALAAPNNLPANFFNVNSQRGVLFATPGTGFQVSGTIGAAVQFGNIDPSYPAIFEPFSPQRLFTAVGSNIVDVTFFLPGTTTPALTNGFGAIFSDVNLSNTTSLQFFDLAGNPLGTFFVPPFAGDQGFSFLGVVFSDAVVGRVRITAGNAALGAGVVEGTSTVDLVTMDDFIYGEPRLTTIPEPASLSLMLTGLLGLAGTARIRRKSRGRVAE